MERFHLYAGDSPRYNKHDTFLADMIAIDIQPTSIVEDKGFQKFVSALAVTPGSYASPSRKTLM